MYMTTGAGTVIMAGTIPTGALATAGVDTLITTGAGTTLGDSIVGAGPVDTMDGDIPIMVDGVMPDTMDGVVTTTTVGDLIITTTTMEEITPMPAAQDEEAIPITEYQALHFVEGPTWPQEPVDIRPDTESIADVPTGQLVQHPELRVPTATEQQPQEEL